MSDENNGGNGAGESSDDSRIIRLDKHIPKSMRNAMQQPATRQQVKDWVEAGCIAVQKNTLDAVRDTGQSVYDQIAEQHKAVFALQEVGFMAVAEALHERLLRLERVAATRWVGFGPPEALTPREIFQSAIDAVSLPDEKKS